MNKPRILQFAKTLRKTQTDAELRLWYFLRGHRFQGFKFKRQKPIGNYIVDFVCVRWGLIIEIDGSQHMEQIEYDNRRTLYLEGQGFIVLRFWSNNILQNIEAVLNVINNHISSINMKESSSSTTSHTPSPGASHHPLPQAGEENPGYYFPLPSDGHSSDIPLPQAGEGGRRPGEGLKETP